MAPSAKRNAMVCDLLGRHALAGLYDPAGDQIRVGGGVRTTILEVALVAVADEVDRHADRGAAVGQAVGELVDGLRLVEAGETEVVLRAIDGDVLVDVLLERRHELLEVN